MPAYIMIVVGLTIIFFGNLGMIILPDLLTRFHAGTKCGVTGTINVMIGLIIHTWGEPGFFTKLLLLMITLFATAPLIAHILAFSFIKNKSAAEEES